MKISTVATIGKGLTVKRKKVEEGEQVIAHLKFSDAVVSREEIDGIVGCHDNWARTCLFDELGAPVAAMNLELLRRDLTVSLHLTGTGDEEMHVAGGTLTGIVLTLDKSGALLAGVLSWPVAGDEVSDAEPLLGQIVRAEFHLTDGQQGDLLRKAA